MVAQTVVMGIMFYEQIIAACVFVCVGSHCLPKLVATSMLYHDYVLENRDSRHRGSGTSEAGPGRGLAARECAESLLRRKPDTS